MKNTTPAKTTTSDRLTTVLSYGALLLLGYCVYRIVEPFLVPLAWSAGATFLCIRTMLGLSVAPNGSAVALDPLLPDGVDRFEAIGLRVGAGDMDVRIARRRGRVHVEEIDARGLTVAD